MSTYQTQPQQQHQQQHQHQQHAHLAWHETLEMHELTAFQSNQLMYMKMMHHNVKDPQLHALYLETIKSVEQNLRELLQYFPLAPQGTRGGNMSMEMTAFYGTQLLIFVKTSVRNYSIAITETATQQLRDTLQKQLNAAILLHGKVYRFVHERGYYPSYDLPKMLSNDVSNANKALSL